MNCAATWNLFFSSSLPLFLLSSHNSRECVTTAQLLRKCYTQWVFVSIPPTISSSSSSPSTRVIIQHGFIFCVYLAN
jgi:hypothetical protein